MADKVKLGKYGEELEIRYRDPKAEKIPQFGMISNFMWRRANFVLESTLKSNQTIMILDPCAGAGRLLSKADKGYEITGYDPEYINWYFGNNYFDQHGYNATMINDCFESHFADSFGPGFHLVISIPYTDRQINAKYETDVEFLKINNYAFYVMSRSMDLLLEKGIAIFCIPKEYVESEKYAGEVELLMKKADIISVESYEEYSIVLFQKKSA